MLERNSRTAQDERPDRRAGRRGRAAVALREFEPEPFVPLHHQVRRDLEMQIRARWSAGAALPGEGELCRHYGVSRGTVRQALTDLAREGLIERHPGRGSFVRQPKFEGSIAGSYRRFRIEGPPLDPGARVLSLVCRRATAETAKILGLHQEDLVYKLERVRFVRGEPVSLQSSVLPRALCPDLDREELSDRHLVDILGERYGVELTHADEYIEPWLADAYVARHLTIGAGTPVFKIERLTYLSDGRVAEFRRAVMRGDTYRYKVELR